MAKGKGNSGGNTAPAKSPAPAAPSAPGLFSRLTGIALLILVANSATGRAADRYAQEHLAAIHRRFWNLVFGLMAIVTIGFGFNLHGLKEINIYLALFFNILFSVYATRPDLLMAILFGGILLDVAQNNADVGKGIKSVAVLFQELALTMLFIVTAVLTVIGFFPFEGNPSAFPKIILLAVLFLQLKKLFNFTGKIGATTALIFTVLMIAFQILTVVPQSWLKEKLHFDPLGFFRAAEDKEIVDKTYTLLQENRIKKNAAEAKLIYNKVKDGNLTELPADLESSLQEKKWTAARNSVAINMIGDGKGGVQWVVMDTFKKEPNRWDKENLGFQLLASFDITKPITIKFEAKGIYTYVFKHQNDTEVPMKINIRKGINDSTLPSDKFPLRKNNCIGCGVLMVNGKIYAIGEEITIPAGKTKIYFSINVPQNWNNSGSPAENFVNNIGEVEVSLLTRA